MGLAHEPIIFKFKFSGSIVFEFDSNSKTILPQRTHYASLFCCATTRHITSCGWWKSILISLFHVENCGTSYTLWSYIRLSLLHVARNWCGTFRESFGPHFFLDRNWRGANKKMLPSTFLIGFYKMNESRQTGR